MATKQDDINRSIDERLGQAVSGLRHEIRHAVREEVEQAEQPAPKDPDAGTFKVTAPGYSEQFTSKRAALASFDGLKKRLIKNEQAAKLRLLVQQPGSSKWTTVQELKLDEDAW